jgi:hypothetical protein
LGEKKCVSGCECLASSWESSMNKVCAAIGDCGSKTNYLGVKGYNSDNVIKKTKLNDSSS